MQAKIITVLAVATYTEVRDGRDRLTEVIIKPLEVTAS